MIADPEVEEATKRIVNDEATEDDFDLVVNYHVAAAYAFSTLAPRDFAHLLRDIADEIAAGEWDAEVTEH